MLLLALGAWLVAVLEGWTTSGQFCLAAPLFSGIALLGRESILARKPDQLFFEVAPVLLLLSAVLAAAVIPLTPDLIATNLATGVLLLIAAMGKSAQTPMHDWLQRAMAGPTPVSALLHSATLVAAGAILLIRTAPMLPPQTLLVVGIVGGITTVVTGLIALGERDLKRLLAASTSSQYGLMLVAVGVGVPLAALLHLIAHAAIKSALFLGAGVFQHSRDSTEFTALKGAGRDWPRIFLGFALAALALAGIPPLSGFFSKDAIIAAALASPHAPLLASFALAGTVLTGAYMDRALHILWYGKRQQRSLAGLGWMGAGLAGLVTLAALLGASFPTIATMLNAPLPENTLAQVLGLSAAISGLALGWFISVQRLLGPLFSWARQGFAIAGGFDSWVVRPAFFIARRCEQLERSLYGGVLAIGQLGLGIGRAVRFGDDRGIDGLIFSLVRNIIKLGGRARTLQSGLIHREMAIMVVGTFVILAALFIASLVY